MPEASVVMSACTSLMGTVAIDRSRMELVIGLIAHSKMSMPVPVGMQEHEIWRSVGASRL